ncbi:MAG: TerC family protein [Flammeovirgaceae bacterium]|nr:MAG: TerC family protein [Flammeovirgaceae bacterium]
MESLWSWAGFVLLILFLLILDLGVFHRKAREISVRNALWWTAFWVTLAFIFNGFIYYTYGQDKAFEFFTGFLIEKSLSVDNIFVIILIFSYFQVPAAYQHKVLFWGILGALIMRFCFIYAGIELIQQFHFLIYLFGAFLIITGIRMIIHRGEHFEPERNPVVRFTKKWFRLTPHYDKDNFFVIRNGLLYATPLLLVVVLIEFTDLIFAVDSIPAILAVSKDPFIVYTSNVFAILGLRSLYFALAGIERYFAYLKYGLAVILVFVGIKMSISDLIIIPIEISLAFIVLTLSVAVLASMVLQPASNPGKPTIQ